MNRDEIEDAIRDLADSPHMREYAINEAMKLLGRELLLQLFDRVADHHQLLHPVARRRVPRNPQLDRRAGR